MEFVPRNMLLGNDDTGLVDNAGLKETGPTDGTTTSHVEYNKMEYGKNDIQNPWTLVSQKQVNRN